MAEPVQCLDDPLAIVKLPICLAAISKNLAGALKVGKRMVQECRRTPCITVKTLATLELATVPPQSRCDDRKFGKMLEGKILVRQLATAYQVPPGGSPKDPDTTHRGFHAGDFLWAIAGGSIVGRISGMSNVGTHRAPAFGKCQVCNQPHVMEGRLCGIVRVKAGHPLQNCRVQAAYRLSLEAERVVGTLEGVLIEPCAE